MAKFDGMGLRPAQSPTLLVLSIHPMPKHFLDCLETVSTLVLLGSVTIGSASITLVILYNMALVLLREAGQMPLLTAFTATLLVSILAYLYNAACDEYNNPPRPFVEDPDPIHYEEDPVPVAA